MYEKINATADNFTKYFVNIDGSFVSPSKYDKDAIYYKRTDVSNQKFKGYYFDAQSQKFCSIAGSYLDPYRKKLLDHSEYNCSIDFDNDEYSTDISDTHYYHVESIARPKLKRFYIGTGVVAEISYIMKEYEFNHLIQEGTPELIYKDIYNEYISLINNIVQFRTECDKAIRSAKPATELEGIFKAWQNKFAYSSFPQYNPNAPIDDVIAAAKKDIYGYWENDSWHNGMIDNYMDDFWYKENKFENTRTSLKKAYDDFASDVAASYKEYKLEHGLE